MNVRYRTVRGMKDIVGIDAIKFQEIISIANEIALLSNFNFLETPIIEYLNLFEKNLGNETDIISKEIYKFEDRSGDMICLRPEFTAGVVRFFTENHLYKNHLIKKYFSYGPLFRYDRPQYGRYRQFYQINFETFHGSGIAIEFASQIKDICFRILKHLNINNLTLKINHLGILKEVREKYIYSFVRYLENKKNHLSEDSKKRLIKNPLRILDSKNEDDIAIINNAPLISEYYTQIEKDFLSDISKLCKTSDYNIKIEIDHKLVRGLDYYTGFIFEIVNQENLAIFGGGEYNDMIYSITNEKQVNCFGFAGGIERLMISSNKNKDQLPLIYFLYDENFFNSDFIDKLKEKIFLEKNFRFDSTVMKNVKTGLEKALKIEASCIFLKGEKEIKNNTIIFKNLISRKQIELEDSIKSIDILYEKKFYFEK